MFPLFSEALIQKKLTSFVFPEDLSDRLQVIHKWLPTLQNANETINIYEFLHDLFVDGLGYASPFNDEHWELELEPVTCLGFFGSGVIKPIVIIDYSGIIDQQISLEDDSSILWKIAINWQYISLSAYQSSPIFKMGFRWQDLLDFGTWQKFYLLMCRRTLLPRFTDTKSQTQLLWEESQEVEIITLKQIYQQLSNVREHLLKDFRHRLSHLPNNQEVAFSLAMKLIGRMLFIAYAIDRQFLPANLISDAYAFFNPYREQSAWDNYKAIFRWLYAGNSRLKSPLPIYTCSLFAPDPLLDENLYVGDELCRQLKEITKFNWRTEISSSIFNCLLELLLQSTKKRVYKYPSKYLLSASKVIDKLQKIDFTNLANYIILDRQCQVGTYLVTALNYLTDQARDPRATAIILLKECLWGIDPSPIGILLTKLNLWLTGLVYTPPVAELEVHICPKLDEGQLIGKTVIEL